MGDLQIPHIRLEKPDPTAQQILQGIVPLLGAISGQLDLLIQITVGHISHEDMKRRFEEFEAQTNGQGRGDG